MRQKARQQKMLLAVTILLRFSCFATVLDGNSRECLTFSFIAQSFAIIFYLLAALPLLLLLLLPAWNVDSLPSALRCLDSSRLSARLVFLLPEVAAGK